MAVAIGLATTQACHRSARNEQPTSATAPVDSIVLERTLCYGTCPAYRLRLAGSGHVVFESRNPGDSGRVASDRVTPDAVRGLVAQASAFGFDSLPDVIARERRFCMDQATDHPTATITLFREAGAKRVEDYHCCFNRSDHSVTNVIARLRQFEAAIDSTARSTRWVRPASRG